ncbi:kelch repeat-containing protein [Paenibacillus larvae]|nr:kelch repeat-containing protein [Paenibacillus larvae]MCY9774698.1 phage tail protein [Paenibacillus larvae]MDR5608373.1 kelch repeat-containing protein [Paenibacillus larvae]
MTTKGRNLQAKAQTGIELKYTRVGIGDGQLAGQSILALNKLINEKKSLPITKLNIQTAGKAVIGTVLSNQEVTTGFYFREIGIYAQDPDVGEILYAYGNSGENAEYIPPAGGADIVEKSIDVIVIVGNAQNVSAAIESSLVPVKSVNGKTGDVVLAAADIQTGSGKDVETTISELFTSVSNGKEQVAKAITDQGVPAVKEDPFKDLAAKIRSIDNGNIPIYVQPTEPIKKTGFWIQDEQNEIEHVFYTDYFSEGTGWTSGADMPTARSNLTSSAVGDKIYVIGGLGSSSKLEIYNTAINTWTAGADMPTGRYDLTSSAVGNKIYVIGGYKSSKLEIYDTATNTWTAGVDMPTERWNLTSSAVGNKIYVIGGWNDGQRNKLEIYDTTTNTWTSGDDMPTARSNLTSSAVGDKIYVIGGLGSSSKLEIYNTSTNTWAAGADMPTERWNLTSSAVGHKIYVIGGSNDGRRNELEIYETTTNIWTVGANMPTARSNLTSSAVGDKIYAIGGWDGTDLNKLEIYGGGYPPASLVFRNGTAKDVSIPNKTKLGVKYSQRIQFHSAYYFNNLAELVYKPMYFGNGQTWTRILN